MHVDPDPPVEVGEGVEGLADEGEGEEGVEEAEDGVAEGEGAVVEEPEPVEDPEPEPPETKAAMGGPGKS